MEELHLFSCRLWSRRARPIVSRGTLREKEKKKKHWINEESRVCSNLAKRGELSFQPLPAGGYLIPKTPAWSCARRSLGSRVYALPLRFPPVPVFPRKTYPAWLSRPVAARSRTVNHIPAMSKDDRAPSQRACQGYSPRHVPQPQSSPNFSLPVNQLLPFVPLTPIRLAMPPRLLLQKKEQL